MKEEITECLEVLSVATIFMGHYGQSFKRL